MLRWRLSISLVVIALLAGCQGERGHRYAHPGERYELAERAYAVQLPPLEMVRDDLLGLVVNMEGMEGVLALIEGAVGLDFANLELFTEAGLDGSMPGLLFGYRGGLVAVIGLTDPGRFEQFLEGLARREAWTFRRTPAEAAVLYDMAGFALAVEGNLLTLYWGGQGESMGHLAALLQEPAPAAVSDLPERGYAIKLNGPAGSLEERLAPSFSQAGLMAGVGRSLARFLDGCGDVTGALEFGDRMVFTADAASCGSGFTASPLLAPEKLVPDDTILLVHARLPVDSLWQAVPPLARYFLADWWRELPGKRPETLTELAAVLGRFDGELSVALLGLGANVNLESLIGSKDKLAPLFGIHWQLLVSLREGEVVDEFFDPELMKLLLPQYQPGGLGVGDLLATEYCRPKTAQAAQRCFTVVRQGQTLSVVTGVGEGDRLMRTLRGQRKSLAESMFAGQRRGPVTVTLKTRRLVKELISKGFPPYFLKILSSVLEVRMTLGSGESGTSLSGEVVLR